MKKLIYIITLLLTTTVIGQTINTTTAFHDTTWQWTDGTNTFQVILKDSGFERSEPIDGITFFLHYKMLSSTGEVIYETRPSIINYNGDLPLGGILGAKDDSPPYIYGQIEDRTDSNYIYGIDGMLKITFIPCQTIGCLPQIQWEIKKPKELVQDPSAPDDYNLPTDIILTKVE